jgi:hypothetical protein
MAISESDRKVRILGRGVREIDRQLLYSAAWLDDPRPGTELKARVRVLDPACRARLRQRSCREPSGSGSAST